MPMPQDFEEDRKEEREAFVLNLSAFEGPIELLYALAKERKIDLAEISILDVVDQYLAFVARATSLEIDLAADWLVMAAWLAYLKSHLLLPRESEAEPRKKRGELDDLAFHLRRLEAVRSMAASLARRNRLGEAWFAPGGVPEAERRRDFAPFGLHHMLLAFVKEAKRQAPPVIPAFQPVDLRSVKDALRRLSGMREALLEWRRLDELLPDAVTSLRSRSELASHFVASLELTKTGRMEMRQEALPDPVYVRAAEDA